MEKITRQQAIEEIVKTCKEGEVITVATDIKDFSWFIKGKVSPHQYLVNPKAKHFEEIKDDRVFLEELMRQGLSFQTSGCAGFYYITC